MCIRDSFRADSIGQGVFFIGQMFSGFNMNQSSVSLAVQQMTPWFVFVLIAGIIGAAPIKALSDKIRNKLTGRDVVVLGKWRIVELSLYILSIILLCWCMIRLSGDAYNPFIYFRF